MARSRKYTGKRVGPTGRVEYTYLPGGLFAEKVSARTGLPIKRSRGVAAQRRVAARAQKRRFGGK